MPSIPSTGPSTLSSVCTISTATRPCPITMIPTIHEKSTLRPGGRQGAAPSALGVAMADEDGVAAVAEPSAELLDQHDRAVSPPRAPERDGEIALSLVLVAGQGEVEEVRQPPEELLGLVPGEDVLGDRGVRAGPVAQLLDEERVWQEPAVDGEVGVARQAVLVAEGHERDGHAAARDAIDEVAERGAPLAHVDAECHARHLLARALPELDEAGDQRDGEIIDAVEAEVLEAPDRGALAGAREPRHDDDA